LACSDPRARVFEDVIDGYFPLHVSLAQMMARTGFRAALVGLDQAPILEIPGLPPEAPVPLNIRAGRAGMIDAMVLWVQGDGSLSGQGAWRWFDGQTTDAAFDPMTRLAEPAIVAGVGFQDAVDLDRLGHPLEGADQTRLWGPLPSGDVIRRVGRETLALGHSLARADPGARFLSVPTSGPARPYPM